MIKSIGLLIILIFIIKVDLFADPLKKLALLSFTTNNVPRKYERIVKDMFEISLYKTGSVKILERQQMNMILEEQGLQMSGCIDNSCAVEIGKILSADFIAYGTVTKFKKIGISIKVVNVKNSMIDFAESQKIDSEKDFQSAVDSITAKLILKIKKSLNEKQPFVAGSNLEKTGSYFQGIIPGWFQLNSGNTMKGSLFLSGFIITGISSAYLWSGYYDKKKYYHDLRSYSENKYDEAYNEYYKSALLFYSSLSVFTLVYIVNWIDVIFFNDLQVIKAGISTSGSDYGFNYNQNYFITELNKQTNINFYLTFNKKF